MFQDILSNIKAHLAKASETLSFENVTQGTARLSDNFDSLKTQTITLSESTVTMLKKSAPRYLLVHKNDEPQTSCLHAVVNARGERELKWPVLVDNKMQWISLSADTEYIPNTDDDDEDIAERFIRVISLDEEKSARSVPLHNIGPNVSSPQRVWRCSRVFVFLAIPASRFTLRVLLFIPTIPRAHTHNSTRCR